MKSRWKWHQKFLSCPQRFRCFRHAVTKKHLLIDHIYTFQVVLRHYVTKKYLLIDHTSTFQVVLRHYVTKKYLLIDHIYTFQVVLRHYVTKKHLLIDHVYTFEVVLRHSVTKKHLLIDHIYTFQVVLRHSVVFLEYCNYFLTFLNLWIFSNKSSTSANSKSSRSYGWAIQLLIYSSKIIAKLLISLFLIKVPPLSFGLAFEVVNIFWFFE